MWILVAILLAAGAYAQPLSVYSEFARIDAKGQVASPENPREILSPAVVRNGYSSFQIVVEGKSEPWFLHIGQNPEDAVGVTLYKEMGETLEPITPPIKGTGTQVFWMDLWVKKDAEVARIKVEPQLNIDDDWVIYPMEVRIESPVIPDGKPAPGTANPVDVMRAAACGGNVPPKPAEGLTQAHLRYRNAQQDIGLAKTAPRAELQKTLGGCTAKTPENPEFYLRIRDYLLRMR